MSCQPFFGGSLSEGAKAKGFGDKYEGGWVVGCVQGYREVPVSAT